MRFLRDTSLFLSLAALSVAGACNNSSSGGGIVTIAPRAGGVVNTSAPVIQLTAVDGAATYRIVVTSTDDPSLAPLVDTPIPQTTTTLPQLADGNYALEWQALDASGSVIATGARTPFRVLDWPEEFADLVVNVHDESQSQKGYRLLNFVRGTQLMCIVNQRGEIVWWKQGPDNPGLYMAPTVLPDGSGVMVIELGRMQTDPNRVGAKVVRMDWNGNTTWETCTEEMVVPHHEVDLMPDGRVAVLLFDWQEFDDGMGGTKLTEGDVIQIRDPITGDVEWEWNIFDHYTPNEWPTPEEALPGFSAYGSDWSHSNGFDWDPTRSMFWLSVRHFDALLGISYPSGEVTTILGNRGIGGEGTMSHQHAPEVQPDGTVLIWDNGNTLDPQVSVAKQFRIDEANDAFELVYSWTEGSYDQAVGDADRLPNGNTLITHGIQRRILEVNPAGETVWELEAVLPNAPWWIYRADHMPAERLPASLRTSD